MKPAKRNKRPAVHPATSPEDQTLAEGWARALASGPVEAVATAIVELGPKAAGGVRLLPAVGGAEIAFLLQVLARPGTDRDVRAAARLALHRLSQGGAPLSARRGIEMGQAPNPGPRPTGPESPESPERSESPARTAPARPGARVATLYRVLGSSYDGNGSRALWLAAERPLGGIYFITMTLHDVQGLIDVSGRDTTRKRFIQQETDMRAKDPMAWAELPVEYGRQLIQEGLSLAREAGRRGPTGYAVWAPVIGEPEHPFAEVGGEPPNPREALIYQDIKAFEAKMHPAWLGETPRLFQQPEIEPWFFEPARVEKLARQLAAPANQRLVITPESAEGRVERLIREGLGELLTEKGLKGLRRRLEETAVIFMQSDRLAEAQRAVAAAATIEESRPLRSPHPFLRAMIDRSIDIAQRVKRTGFEPIRLAKADQES